VRSALTDSQPGREHQGRADAGDHQQTTHRSRRELGLKAFGLIPESMDLGTYVPELLTSQIAGSTIRIASPWRWWIGQGVCSARRPARSSARGGPRTARRRPRRANRDIDLARLGVRPEKPQGAGRVSELARMSRRKGRAS
jgi:hypothetical protein